MGLLAASSPEAPLEVLIDSKDPSPFPLSKVNFTLVGIITTLVVILVGA
jgi:hypothetical protein